MKKQTKEKVNYEMPEKKKITRERYEKLEADTRKLETAIIDMARRLTETMRETREITDSSITALRTDLETLNSLLVRSKKELEGYEIGDELILDTDLAEIGDQIDAVLNIEGEQEEVSFVLVSARPESESEISIESPIGKSIYRKAVGTTNSYTVKNMASSKTYTNKVTITNIVKPKKLVK